MKTPTLLLVLLLSGCATCEHHPYLCSAVAAVAAASLALCLDSHTDRVVVPRDVRPVKK